MVRTRTSRFAGRLAAAAIGSALALASPAAAAPRPTGSFDVAPATPGRLALGPDGNVWVLLSGAGNDDVARIDPASGAVSRYDDADIANATGIAAGPDGRLWVTRPLAVTAFAPADPTGTSTSYAIATLTSPQDVVAGPDGNLWTASNDQVFKIATNGTVVAPSPYTVAGMGARGIARGADDRLWIADFGSGRVVAMTTAGVPTPVTVGGGPQDVAAATAASVAYSNPGAIPQVVGRIALGGGSPLPSPVSPAAADPFGVTFGSDGAYWFAQFAGQNLGRVTTAGEYTTPIAFPAASGPRRIARGPRSTLFVSLETAQKVARVSGVEPPPAGPPPGTTPDATPPVLSGAAIRPAGFRATRHRAVRVRFTLSEAATVALRVERALPGRRRAGRCVRPSPRTRGARRCTRHRRAATLRVAATAGASAVALPRRIRARLRPGAHRIVLVARDAAGNRSTARRVRFRVLPPPKRPR